jgi:hypothetical protein
LSTTDIDTFERLLKQVAPNEAPQIVALVKKLRADLVTANSRAMKVAKELKLPAGTIVISPDSGTWGVIGKDGMIDPKSVKPLDPHAYDAVGGIFFTPSKRPVGSDGSGQSLIGPGFVNQDGSVVGKSGLPGLPAAIADAQAAVRGGTLSTAAIVKEARERVQKGVLS